MGTTHRLEEPGGRCRIAETARGRHARRGDGGHPLARRGYILRPMFIGHQALALAGRQIAPEAPLGTHVPTPFRLDILCSVLPRGGCVVVRIAPANTGSTPVDFVRHPRSRSALTSLAWGGAFGVVAWVPTRQGRAALVTGA